MKSFIKDQKLFTNSYIDNYLDQEIETFEYYPLTKNEIGAKIENHCIKFKDLTIDHFLTVKEAKLLRDNNLIPSFYQIRSKSNGYICACDIYHNIVLTVSYGRLWANNFNDLLAKISEITKETDLYITIEDSFTQ